MHFSNLFPSKWLRITWNGQFCPIHNFSNLFPLKQLRITLNGQFCSICNFSNLFQPKQLTITWNGQFCLIHKFSNLFPPKLLRITRNSQFHLIHNFSKLFHQSGSLLAKCQNFSLGGGGTSAKFSQICNFLNHFQLENDPQWPILTPKWLKLAQNGQFWSFFNFSQVFPQKAAQIDSIWPISPDSQLFQSFPTKAPHFWQNLKFFHFGEGGYIELRSCQICHKQGSCRTYGTAVYVEV